jgi:fucose permease
MNMSSRQITGKSKLRATMLGVFLAVFYAGYALGAVTWGAFAKAAGTKSSLALAALGLLFIGCFKFWLDAKRRQN